MECWERGPGSYVGTSSRSPTASGGPTGCSPNSADQGAAIGTAAAETITQTKVTSWRVPADQYPGEGAAECRFTWSVEVIRQPEADDPQGPSRTGSKENPQETFEVISAPGDVREFEWQ